MRLTRVQITEYQSVRDSGEFEIGDVTCLVGKNEAGKTSILRALYRLNPVIEADAKFDVTDDYPRSDVEDYQQAVADGQRQPARVVRAVYRLDDEDLSAVAEALGNGAVVGDELVLNRGYDNTNRFTLSTDLKAVLKHFGNTAQLPVDTAAALGSAASVDAALEVLKGQEQTSEVQRLSAILTQVQKSGLNVYIYTTYLKSRVPKFLYFDEYYQMKGFENIEALKQRVANKVLQPSDHPMLGLVDLARLNLDQLLNAQRTQELVNKLEGAGNHLSRRILKYWSQNRHLQMRFDVRPARAGDPEGMRTGTNIWAGVYDAAHMVTTGLGTRSRGFVWFFSFLAWYSQLQRKSEPLVLLLDEPGLTLHAKAQADLLRYFEEELKEEHQLIYTTHSPFMVDPLHFDRVRIVQDKSIDADEPLPRDQEGTKVLTEVFDASQDSLFPLQGALGYEIYQTLFVGPNSLVVEGISDLLYIQAMTELLTRKGRVGLSAKWTITPVGGSDKVPTFVALLGAQKNLNIATLIDLQTKDQQSVENLYKRKLLKKKNVLTFAEFTGAAEADIEDMFDRAFFLKLVNAEFKGDLAKPIGVADLGQHPRVLIALEKHFETSPLKKGISFSHYRPARYFVEHATALEADIADAAFDRFEKAFKALNALLKS